MKLQSAAKVNRRICLVVIDGWGLASDFDDGQTGGTDGGKRDAIKDARAETMLHLATTYPSTQLVAHGLDVGLPEGLMGNSEVGHLNLGAGRIVYQDIVRIDQACREGSLERTLLTHLNIDEDDGSVGPVHLVGLVSDGGVHSSLEHVKYMLGVLRRHNITAYLHAITDGRDTAPKSALKYLEPVKNNIATIVGRYYAMDRDRRWERTQLALHALLTDCADQFTDFEDLKRALEDKYAAGETDEFFRPLIKRGSPRISGTVVCFNFRSDRMRQLVSKFRESPQVQRCICMTRYSEDFEQLPVLSPPQSLKNVLSEVVSLHGLQQCHIAETEKYAHVTFFFNGGREEPFAGEDRTLIPSPKVSTYDLKPEMSVSEVADAVVDAVGRPEYAFVLTNLAPPDMVGHTGNYEATVRAVKATDAAVQKIYAACQAQDVTLIVTADHGNAEQMTDAQGHPHTAHTCSPVPLIVCQRGVDLAPCHSLPDVAPLILQLMGIPIPSEMAR